jgi:DNA-binding MarR family transcriptional regulator
MNVPGARPHDACPGDRLLATLELLDDFSVLGRANDGLLRHVAGLAGLRAGELQALFAVSEGATDGPTVARTTGQVDRAGEATVEQLVRRGLVGRHRHPDAPDGRCDSAALELTEAGRVVVQQAEGLMIRALHTVHGRLGDRRAGHLRGTVQALGAALAEQPLP